MPDIYFFESRESGVPDSYTTLHIPDTGTLLPIPFQWDGKYASMPTFIESQRNRQQPGQYLKPERVFPAVITGYGHEVKRDMLVNSKSECVYIIWVEERNEWVVFSASYTHGRSDNYGYSDAYVDLLGPWAIDESHSRALISGYLAYGLTDLAKVLITAPSVFERERAKYILGRLGVRGYPHNDAGPGLAEIAKMFGRGFGIKPTMILLDGYLQDGEKHGGYPHHEEHREEGGQGIQLYSYRCLETPPAENPRVKHERVVELQIWHIKPNQTRFLVIDETFDDGYLGIDNFPGYEKRWVVLQNILIDNPAKITYGLPNSICSKD